MSADTRLLILGSFPGIASIRAQQYYGHPQNQFWKIMRALWPSDVVGQNYRERSEWLLSKKVGVWDVYASCEREGSLDANIRNAVLNDFSVLARLCPGLEGIAHNGGESFRHAANTCPFTSCPPRARQTPHGVLNANLPPGGKFLTNTD